MAQIELINKGSHTFIDVSTEIERTYEWGDGFKLNLKDPQWLAVSTSGHRLLTLDGISHFIPFGWKHLWWEVKTGAPNFVK